MEPGKNKNELSLTEFVLVLVTRLKVGHKKVIFLGIIPIVPRSLLPKTIFYQMNQMDPLEKWLTAGLGPRKF